MTIKNNNIFRKMMVIEIIVLFIGTSVIPSTGNILTEKCDSTTTSEISRDNIAILEWKDPPDSYDDYMSGRKTKPFSVQTLFEVTGETNNPMIIVFVNASLLPHIEDEITVYNSTLVNLDYNTVILEVSGGTVEDLKNQTLNYWDDGHNVTGAVLIGDLPVAWYYHENDFHEKPAEFPCDLFLMDLDGQWNDTDSDGMYDSHTDGAGDTAPEIYVGRIDASNIPGDEINSTKKYLDKVHEFWMHNITRTDLPLTYTDNDWANYQYFRHDIGYAYYDYDAIWYPDVTRDDYVNNRLPNASYEFIQLACHSSSNNHYFSSGLVGSDDIRAAPPMALFYNLFCCGALRFTKYNCLGNAYILDTDSPSLAVVGSTKSGSMLDFRYFYEPIGQGCSFGEAFRQWFNYEYPYLNSDVSWFYGMTILGDPTLVIKLEHNVDVKTLDVPSHVKANEMTYVNATIFNNGKNNETNVSVSFRVNGSELDNTTISFFERQTAQQVSFPWIPLDIGACTVSVNVTIQDVSDEYYNNNERNKTVTCGVQNSDTGECFHTIQDAIDDNDTLDGHSIFIPSGIYYENIIINKNISLRCRYQNSVVIEDTGSADSVIHVQNTNLVNITGLIIRNGIYGVCVESSVYTAIHDNVISSNSDAGIYLTSSHDVVIMNNEICNNAWGILVADYSSNTNISDNYIHDNKAISRPDPPTTGASGGSGKTGNNIPPPNTLNIPPNNALAKAEAVMPFVRYRGGGIKLDDTTSNTIVFDNDLIDNYYGLKIVDGSTSNTIHHNKFDNSKNAFDAGSYSTWDDGYYNGFRPYGGNWWSDYDSNDEFSGPSQNISGSDGIGDVRYDISGGSNQDRYPLMNPWTGPLTCTIFVDGDNTVGPWEGTHEHPYLRIKSATDSASNDDTIFVFNGTYYENVVVNKTISLIGEDRNATIIDAEGTGGSVFTVNADWVNIEGFTIQSGENRYAGIAIMSNHNTIFGNTIMNNYDGISLRSSVDNIISWNIIKNNDQYGISLSESSVNIISGNSIENNQFGISLDHTTNENVISGNTISNNSDYGITMDYMSDENIIYHNNFINNNNGGVQAYDEGEDIWDDDYPSGGNYWSDYTGIDENEDGIGDTSYNILGGSNLDNYPLMTPYQQ